MIGRIVFSTSSRRGHETQRRERSSRAIAPGASPSRRQAGRDLLGGDMRGVDSRESRILVKRSRSLWGLSHAGVGLTLRSATWRRARCSSAAEDVSGAAGRRVMTCATAGDEGGVRVHGVLMLKGGRLRAVCEVELGW